MLSKRAINRILAEEYIRIRDSTKRIEYRACAEWTFDRLLGFVYESTTVSDILLKFDAFKKELDDCACKHLLGSYLFGYAYDITTYAIDVIFYSDSPSE